VTYSWREVTELCRNDIITLIDVVVVVGVGVGVVISVIVGMIVLDAAAVLHKVWDGLSNRLKSSCPSSTFPWPAAV
jgi:hypothetical protein